MAFAAAVARGLCRESWLLAGLLPCRQLSSAASTRGPARHRDLSAFLSSSSDPRLGASLPLLAPWRQARPRFLATVVEGPDGSQDSAVEDAGSGDEELDNGADAGEVTPDREPLSAKEIEQAAEIGYQIVGRVKPEEIPPYRAPKAFAIVQVGSHQFKISPGDYIYTEKLKHADVNDKLCLLKVLLLGSKAQTIIGRPVVPKAAVHAVVEEQLLDAKVIIFKKKRRKNYRRHRGHRQELTRLRILDIRGLGEARSARVGALQPS